MTEKSFSVLLSVYAKEKPEYLDQCLDSLYNQSVQAKEWVMVEDGPLTHGLEDVLNRWQIKFPNLKRIPIKENVGLGLALQTGVLACSYPLIARMDTDDICEPDRFEKQWNSFVESPDLDICGSHIEEFYDDPKKTVSRRIVPLSQEEIVQYQKRRDAFNHMSVMFKKEAVLKAGNYQSCPLMEDTLLWCNMLKNGAHARNLDEFLVHARTNDSMFERRGGWNYFKKYKTARKRVYDTGFLSYTDYLAPLGIQCIFAILPNSVRKLLYKCLLRS